MTETNDLRPNQRKAVEALASGHSVEETAVIAGVQVRTIYNWKVEPAFKQALQDLNDSLFADSTAFLSSSLMGAFKTMVDIMNDENTKQSIRLNAAKAIADSALKVREQLEIIQRISELESRIHEIDHT